ncbi:uncharacterized protein LOC105180102 [Sesamum indicum]|uniref:Uncharacterized protein LOC105180102 n=1 Tax=Sesamum indicum TaxID=4182 RepID=A0A6I9UQP9_SESIN|nr:uncharacterized protein LOC105180102 [Sesamum indicum]
MNYALTGNRIWIRWDDNFLDVTVVELSTQFLHCHVTIRALQESVDITVIYGATELADRRSLWDSLSTIAIQCMDTPRLVGECRIVTSTHARRMGLVGGDFNAVRDLSEVCGASGDIWPAMEEFNYCIQNAGLLPLPMQGEWYTWHNCSASPSKRLDRMLINDTWIARFPTSTYLSLTPRTSDHSPLVLCGDRQQQLGGIFRFDNYLTRSPKFIPSVQNVWKHEVVGVPMCAVTRKLKALKPIFREQRRNKGDLSHNVQLANGFLEAAQNLVSANRQEEVFLYLEHCCRMVLAKAAKLEQIMLHQRAKMEWMKDGEQCSKVVLLGGQRRRDVIDIQFLRPWARHLVTEDETNSLLSPFTPSDVKEAVFDIAEDKAPGPDGYSSGFFKAAWPIVGGKSRLPPRCALKVDIRKAYDSIEWDFLVAVLELFGFPPTFIRWIEECVTTPSFSVGLNGKPHGFFSGARGLRQGDPLSPYLFVLVLELGFADDMLLFCRADIDSIEVLKRGLDRFAVWSGLRLNVQKSHLIISRSAQGLREEMLEALGFQEGLLPLRYLGLPLLSSRLTIADCQPLLAKIDKRIAGWEGMTLSYAGRVQIIKSVLMSLSLYWTLAFILPKRITNEIEKRLRNFLWKGSTNSGYAKVASKELCRPVDEGGLGFKDITTLNRALMTKKLCDIIQCDRTSIWVEWLYHDQLRDTSIWTIRDHGSSWSWRKLLRLRIFLRPMVDNQIGDGRKFHLWQDPWHYLGPFIETFPRGSRLLGLEKRFPRLAKGYATVYTRHMPNLLSKKLSVILDKIISPCQAAFVPGRSIGDNVMLAQELFTGYNQARLPPRCALKVDIRKAYDTVEWDFLLSVLQLFGFPETFSRWVEECISSPSFSVGMNGKPHGYFAGARGL